MNFLTPWFFAGAALVLGPILAHLIRRATRDRVEFSATRFLAESPPQLQRRSRLQHPLLLALRCLIVALLAAAFARPFFRSETPPAAGAAAAQDIVIVLDDSASMRRTGLWNQARERVLEIVDGLRPADRCTVLVASSAAAVLVSSEQWAQTPPGERSGFVRALLAAREPGWGATHLDTAIDAALEQFAESPVGTVKKRILVVSDFASGARLSGLAGRDWPPDCEVAMENVVAPLTNNAGLQWLGWSTDDKGTAHARVRVSRDRQALTPALQLQLHDALNGKIAAPAQTISLEPGEARVVLFPKPADVTGPLRLKLSGDSETFDNTLWLAPPTPREIAVAYLGRHEATDTTHARFYLERALSGSRDPIIRVNALDATLPGPALATSQMIVVAEPLSASAANAVRLRVEQGAFAVTLLASPEMVSTAATLAGETGWTAAPAGLNDALLGQIDFAHPLFALFADPRFSDFTRVRFWRPQPITLPADSRAHVAARFEDGSAAVIEAAHGRGRVVTWGGDWSPAAGQWVLSSKFVPWLEALLERASGGPVRPGVAEVGDLRQLTADLAATWRPVSAADNDFASTPPSQPGAYQLKDEAGTRWVALHVPADESRTDPLPLDAFEQLGIPLKAAWARTSLAKTEAARIDAAALELEGRQKLWRWLLLAAAVLLGLESLTTLFVSRHERAAAVPVST
jgi:hypothetical protein